MSHRTNPRTARRWPLALTLLTVTRCASTAQNTPRNEQPTATPVASAQAPAPLSVPQAPAGLIVQVHAASLGPIAERIGGLVSLSSRVPAVLDELLADVVGHDPALAAVVDRGAPVRFALVGRGQGDPEFAFAFGIPHAADTEQRLGQSHRVGERTLDGVRVLTPTETAGRRRRNVCAIVETGADSSSRLVCSATAEALDRLGPWMARGASPQVAPFTVRAELAVEALRGQYGEMATLLLTQAASSGVDGLMTLVPEPSRSPAVREAMGGVLDLFTETARSIVSDLSAGSLTLAVEPDRMVLSSEMAMRGSQATLVRAVTAATQGNTLPTELTANMPAGGVGYTAASVDLEPLRPTLQRFANLLVAVVRGDGRTALRAPDADALRAALEHLVGALGRTRVAATSGADADGAPWSASTLRYGDAQGPTGMVGRAREVITALRRPAVTRNINSLFTLAMGTAATRQNPAPDMRQLGEVTIRGLPAGSFAFSIPRINLSPASVTPAFAAGSRRPAVLPAARPINTVVALIPQGNDLRVVSGPDAATVARHAASATPTPGGADAHAAPDAAAWAAAGGWAAMLLVPAGLPNFLRRTDANGAGDFERMLATLPQHGRNPVTIATGLTVQGDTANMTATLAVTRDTLGAWVAVLSRSPAPPPPPVTRQQTQP